MRREALAQQFGQLNVGEACIFHPELKQLVQGFVKNLNNHEVKAYLSLSMRMRLRTLVDSEKLFVLRTL